MPRRRPLLLLTSLLAAGGLNAGAAKADPHVDTPPKGEPVPFETLAIVSGSAGINLGAEQIIRIANDDDIDPLSDLLAAGHDSTLTNDVVDAIGATPPATVVLVGVIDVSCTPATRAGLVRQGDGELAMFAPGHVPEPIECVVANVTVAVLAVDAVEAPPGSADGAQLVHFAFAGYEHPRAATAVELTTDPDALEAILPNDADVPALPDVPSGTRRLAFVRAGCRFASAELWVTPAVVTVHFDHEDPHGEINCDQAEYYLAVFDVPGNRLATTTEIDGSSLT